MSNVPDVPGVEEAEMDAGNVAAETENSVETEVATSEPQPDARDTSEVVQTEEMTHENLEQASPVLVEDDTTAKTGSGDEQMGSDDAVEPQTDLATGGECVTSNGIGSSCDTGEVTDAGEKDCATGNGNIDDSGFSDQVNEDGTTGAVEGHGTETDVDKDGVTGAVAGETEGDVNEGITGAVDEEIQTQGNKQRDDDSNSSNNHKDEGMSREKDSENEVLTSAEDKDNGGNNGGDDHSAKEGSSAGDGDYTSATNDEEQLVIEYDEIPDNEDFEREEEARRELMEKILSMREEYARASKENDELQQYLFEFFQDKKADAQTENDKSVTDQEQRYIKCLNALRELKKEFTKTKSVYESQISELNQRHAEKQEKFRVTMEEFSKQKRDVVLAAENSRTGKGLPRDVVDQYLENEARKESEVVTVRLVNMKLRNKLKKKDILLRQKEELADGLHLIDFEQLKIENQTYNEKIEERNEELLKLQKKITNTVQVLTHLKEKLSFVQVESADLRKNLRDIEKKVADHRDLLSHTKQARDTLRADNTRLRQKSGLVGNEPLLRDFENKRALGDRLRMRLEELKQQHTELTVSAAGYRKKTSRIGVR